MQSIDWADPGALVDGELRLVEPSIDLIDAMLDVCKHPDTLAEAPYLRNISRQQWLDFIAQNQHRCEAIDPDGNKVPAYSFWMCTENSPLPIAGSIRLRVARSKEIEYYWGHFGYHVFPPCRGRHYAERACRLLFPLAKRHQLSPLWITCDPDNIASQRTCERLGGKYMGTAPVPIDHLLYASGQREKRRYRIDLA
jgi:predicted acetyltransferase